MSSTPRVLVVDDDQNIISAFEDFFRREHCTMIAASTAQDAIRILETSVIDLLITDIRLKEQSGVTLFMRMKEMRPEVPVIVITGYPESISENDVRALGATSLLLKPLELRKLREAIRTALHQAGRSEPKLEKPRWP